MMGLIPAVKVWGTERLLDADLNGAFASIRNTVNGTALFTDVVRTITAELTFSTPPVFSNAQTFAAGVTVAAGGLTVTAGGLTVSAGGVTVTGTVTATVFAGSGSGLTGVPSASLTGALPAISGASLTDLNASSLTSGTVDALRLPSSYPTLSVTTFTAGNIQPTGFLSNGVQYLPTNGSGGYMFVAGSSYEGITFSSPSASSASLWMNVRVGTTDYRIPLFEV